MESGFFSYIIGIQFCCPYLFRLLHILGIVQRHIFRMHSVSKHIHLNSTEHLPLFSLSCFALNLSNSSPWLRTSIIIIILLCHTYFTHDSRYVSVPSQGIDLFCSQITIVNLNVSNTDTQINRNYADMEVLMNGTKCVILNTFFIIFIVCTKKICWMFKKSLCFALSNFNDVYVLPICYNECIYMM